MPVTLTSAQREHLRQAAAALPSDLYESFMRDVMTRFNGYRRPSDRVVDDIVNTAVQRLSETKLHAMFCDAADDGLEAAAARMRDAAATVVAMANRSRSTAPCRV